MLNDIVFIEALYFKGIFWEKLSYAAKLSKKCHVLRFLWNISIHDVCFLSYSRRGRWM